MKLALQTEIRSFEVQSSAGHSTDDQSLRIGEIVAALKGLEGPLLPILHAVQDELGYVPAAAVPVIAHALNLSRAEVHGIVSFYHDFRHEPAGRAVIRLCRAEACQSRGADALAARVGQRLGIGFHQTTADGAVTLEPVFCLGLCAAAPCGMIDDTPLARLTEARMDVIVDRLKDSDGLRNAGMGQRA